MDEVKNQQDDKSNFTVEPIWQTRHEIATSGSECGFRNAISVYINKPHVVNRRLCGAKILQSDIVPEFTEYHVGNLKTIFTTSSGQGEVTVVDQGADVDLNLNRTFSSSGFSVIIRDLLPKQVGKYPTLREIVCYDHHKECATFYPVCHVKNLNDEEASIKNELLYQFCYTGGSEPKIQLKLPWQGTDCEMSGHVTEKWLAKVLLPKLGKWTEEEKLHTAVSSLTLVPIDEYSHLYNHLKSKYGQEFVKIWPEKTDPQKFVFEDVAIATYLLLLWKDDREKKNLSNLQTFVDLGCGNGLLVHILASEGHRGLGLDIRRRKIWDLYGPKTLLKESSIVPSADSLFPDYDWLIGNHSDELTPWIPVMAARSSYTCNYFVLPCCHFDFDAKFNKREQGSSQYRTYLNFVQNIGDVCGFRVEEDTLRIPSTKRVCFIGRERTYPKEDESSMNEKRTAYVKGHCINVASKGNKSTHVENEQIKEVFDSGEKSSSSAMKRKHEECNSKNPQSPKSKLKADQWSSTFEPRSSTEAVRNCQKIAKKTKEKIVQTVFEEVLNAADAELVPLTDGRQWRKGGTVPLSAVAKLFDRSVLQELKSECGGLQTLLRNHHNVFQVSGGIVRLRDFSTDNPWSQTKAKRSRVDANEFFKTVPCWFYSSHPDGCPRLSEKCDFAHGQSELRERPKKKDKL